MYIEVATKKIGGNLINSETISKLIRSPPDANKELLPSVWRATF